jgi:hypothetical protein
MVKPKEAKNLAEKANNAKIQAQKEKPKPMEFRASWNH